MKRIKEVINWDINDIIKVLVGSFLFCFAINVFIVPNHLYSGGILGTSQLLRNAIMHLFNLNINFDISGIIYYLINIPLFYIAYKRLSKTFFVRTIIAVSIQSLMLLIIPSPSVPVVKELLTNVIIGGIICGAGVGITLSSGASTGGTDIIGLALSKRNNNFSVGKIGLFLNVIIYLITGLVYGIQIMIYSIFYSVVESMAVDKLHEQNICSTALIFCKEKPIEINNYIKNELGRDFTYWDATGGYNDSRSYIVYTVLSKYELVRLEKFIKDYKNTFMIKSDGVTVRGEFEKKF